MAMHRLCLFAALAVLVGLLVGCTGPVASSAGPVQTDRVDLPPSYRFDPPLIQVAAGTTVTWTNRDNFSHSVQVEGGEFQDLPIGQSASIRFETPGQYQYLCTYHPQNMKGTVVVTAN